MSSAPAGLAAQLALNQQNVALATLKQSAENDRAIADILEKTLTVTASSRGGSVNTTA